MLIQRKIIMKKRINRILGGFVINKEKKVLQIKNNLILISIAASLLIGAIIGIVVYMGEKNLFTGILIFTFMLGLFIIYPIMLTIINIGALFIKTSNNKLIKSFKINEIITIILGTLYSMFVLMFYEIHFDANWTETLVNNQRHTPIFTENYLTIGVLACIGILGYIILSTRSINKMPPLLIVLSISFLYIGIVQCVLWIVQIFSLDYLLLCLFPFNAIIIAISTIKSKIIQWNKLQHKAEKVYKNSILNFINIKLANSKTWPINAFILFWPVLGILICILVLFGQEPDAAIKAWTETSDWNLSKRVAPQNIYIDEHYLCTVAAGGHKKIVKPIRLGLRHDHEVIVNRQLCIANAFEEILEEKIPKIHKFIRNFYDKYGFPIAKMIKSPYIADIIYIIMKPLEYIFLIVIYFCDIKPEDRIAIQYLPRK